MASILVSKAGEAGYQPTPSPMSRREKDLYYVGLWNRPYLVARSSAFDWKPPTQRGEKSIFYIRKQLHAVGDHPIHKEWHKIAEEIRKEVDHTSCYATDIAEIRYLPSDDYPPNRSASEEQMQNRITVMLSVENGSVAWAKANAIVHKCQDILNRYNMHDVSCEINENELLGDRRLRAIFPLDEDESPLFPKPAGSYRPMLHGRRAHLIKAEQYSRTADGYSTSFAQYKIGGVVATKGLYLRPKGEKSVIYALATRNEAYCNHIEPPTNAQAYRPEAADNKLAVFESHSIFLEVLVKNEKDEERSCRKKVQSCLAALLDNGGHPDDDKDPAPGRKPVPAAILKAWKEAKEDLLVYQDDVLYKEKVLEACKPNRMIGHVKHIASREATPWCFDWSLVELNSEHQDHRHLKDLKNNIRFDERQQREYNSYCGGDDIPCPNLTIDGSCFSAARELGSNGEISVKQEIVSESELDAGSGNLRFLPVGKIGETTGLRFGEASRLRSLLREPGNNKDGWALHWPIYGAPTPYGASDFCIDTDSGSCIFDLTGRVVGIACGGKIPREVSYVMPMERVLSLAKEAGFDLELL